MARERQAGGGHSDNRGLSWPLRILYWVAVLAVSILLLIGLILLLESRDSSSVGGFLSSPLLG